MMARPVKANIVLAEIIINDKSLIKAKTKVKLNESIVIR
jgi:hypothetical protein